ncbi:MAG: GTPase HflX, partial [Clostridiales bacterium]|nr:GTPase HflX [Clostridiales bacterium]
TIIEKELFNDYQEALLLIPFNKGDIVSYLNEHAHIITQKYTNNGTLLKLELSQMFISKYQKYIQ